VLLAAAGGARGALRGWWLVRARVGVGPAGLPDVQPSTLDVRVLGFTAVLSLGTGVLFGLLPAWTAASCPPADAMRTGGRATRRGERSRAALMVAEIALALVLVVGAALLLRGFLAIVGAPPGFDTHGVLTANLTPGAPRYADIPTRTGFFADFESAVASMPGVRAVGLTTSLPIGGDAIFHNLAFEGRPMDPGTEPEVYYRGVSAGYFAALGIPLRRGRQFGPDDFRAGAPRVAIVNDAFTREYYPQEDPVGRRIRWASGPADWMTIVGVVADVRGLSLERDEVPAVHVPYAQEVNPWRTWIDVVVRTSGTPLTLAPAIRQQLSRLDRTVPLLRVRSMDDVLARSVAERRFSLHLLGGFALLALVLSAAGTYGAVAYSVLQQTREIAIRIALGARRRDVLVLVVGRAVGLAAAGVAAGLALAFALSRALDGLLLGIGATDPAAFAAGALVLLAAAFAASYLPAHRAARIDPLAALRSE
jgi:putative ABC transport system permease protein